MHSRRAAARRVSLQDAVNPLLTSCSHAARWSVGRSRATQSTAVDLVFNFKWFDSQEAFMKFYDCVTAPSPRRVRIFLAEKGLAVPTVQVDLRNGEQFTPACRALNPDFMVPVLELDSGAAITDIIAICRYFEELHPDPPLMGRSAEEKAVVESWLRRIEWDGIYAAQEV